MDTTGNEKVTEPNLRAEMQKHFMEPEWWKARSTLFKVFQDSDVFYFHGFWFLQILSHSHWHDPEPREGNRPAHFWLIRSCQRISADDSEANRTFALLGDKIGIHQYGHFSKSKHGSEATRSVYLPNLGLWSNEGHFQEFFSLREVNVSRINMCPVYPAPGIRLRTGRTLFVFRLSHAAECVKVPSTVLAIAHETEW